LSDTVEYQEGDKLIRTIPIYEYRNAEACAECGGKCCNIYGDADKDEHCTRDMNMWFEEWCDGFHKNRDNYGVVPLFDPLVIFQQAYWDEQQFFEEQGYDTRFCEYRDPMYGCRIPRDRRPSQCTQFRCKTLYDSPATEGILVDEIKLETPFA
jgi:hypothetical protein